MNKPIYTTQKQVRDTFWLEHPTYQPERRSRKRQNDYRTDIRVSFVDYVDRLRRNGFISEALASRVTL